MVEMMFAVSQGDTLKVPELIFKKEQKKKNLLLRWNPWMFIWETQSGNI